MKDSSRSERDRSTAGRSAHGGREKELTDPGELVRAIDEPPDSLRLQHRGPASAGRNVEKDATGKKRAHVDHERRGEHAPASTAARETLACYHYH